MTDSEHGVPAGSSGVGDGHGGHDIELLGAYALGLLDSGERQQIDERVATCTSCRDEAAELADVRVLLDTVPPEAFLDGRPDNELVLQRTVRELRTRQQRDVVRGHRVRRSVAAAAAVILLVAGLVLGRHTAPAAPVASPGGTVTGSRTVSAHDPKTGVGITAVVIPEPGWVVVQARFSVSLRGWRVGW